jgi:RHS repeat-associated protein
VIWAVKAMNAAGQVTDEILRNGVETASVRNDATGWLLSRTATAHADGDTRIQDFAFAFDEAGSLRTRLRLDAVNAANSSETFGYDALDRLTSAQIQIPSQNYATTDSYGFNEIGNLTTKAGKTYKYGTGCLAGTRAAGPHALCQIDSGPVYSYDANGNLLSSGDRSLIWNAANKATHLTSGTQAADFVYGADGQRVVQAIGTSGGSTQSRTVYVGLGATGKSLYERTTRGGKIEHAHFIYAGTAHGGSALAVRTVTEDASSVPTRTQYRFRHFDHLGSVTAESDESGHVATAAWAGSSAGIFGYDAWGARRSPDGRAADPASFSPPTGHRGFTDQEDIEGLGLVNMNGRIYDPVVGRFLSADSHVQFASSLQSYNRYSYATGNPLKYTDPTGYYNVSNEGDLSSFVVTALSLTSWALCPATAGGGCALGLTLASSMISATAVIASGESWRQVLVSAVSFGAGLLCAEIGYHIGGAIGGEDAPVLAATVGGSIGGAAAAAVMTPITGGNLGQNIITGAMHGAMAAAFVVAIEQDNPLSQADVQERAANIKQNLDRYRGQRLAQADEDDVIEDEEWEEITNGPRLEPERNPYGTTQEQEELRESMPFRMRDVPPTATRRIGTIGDTQFRTANDALREALIRHGVDPSTVEVQLQYGKNPNLVGSRGEPWQIVQGLNSDGELIEFDHHANGHFFEDTNEFELPHYEGPNKEHLSY